MASTESLPVKATAGKRRDVCVNEFLTLNSGITGIPISGFYSPENQYLADDIIRFAYCKNDQDLSMAKERLVLKS